MGTAKKNVPEGTGILERIGRSPLAYAIVAVLSAVLYWQTLGYALDKFDEDMILTPNMEYLVKTATVKDVLRRDAFFRTPGRVFYRPVQNVSYLIDAKIGRGKPAPFHATNILLHALASCLVLTLLRRVTARADASFLGALFFCISPLLAQAIAWTPGRGELLMAVFGLSSLLTLHSYLTSTRVLWLVAYIVSTLLAIFSKETSAVLLLLLPLSWIMLHGVAAVDRRRLILTGLVPVLFTAVLLVLRSRIITDPPVTNGNAFNVLHLVSNLRVFPEIAAKMIAPPLVQTMAGYTVLATALGAVVLALLIGASLRGAEPGERSLSVLGLTWYGAFLLPGAMYVHRFGAAAYDYLEHRGYVPVIGLVVILALLLDRLSRRVSPLMMGLSGAAIIALYGFATYRHAADFATPMSFYDQAAESNPASALARTNRGQLRLTDGDTAGAVADYTASLARYPDFLVAHFGLGTVYLQNSRPDSAIFHLRAAYDLDTTLTRLAYLLGNAYLNVSPDSSIKWYRVCYERDATDFEATINLGVLEMRRGNYAAALEIMTQATQRAPNQSLPWLNRGHIYSRLGMPAEACNDWLRAEQLGNQEARQTRLENCR